MSTTGNETPDEGVTGPTTLPDEERDPLQEGEPPEVDEEDTTPATTEPDESEPTDEPQSAAVRTDREMEKVFRDLDRLRKDVAGRVGRIFGDEATQLMECPLCAATAPGYLWPPDVAPLADEQITALRLLLNMPVATDYKQTEDFIACPKCDGLGRVRTGSKVQNYEIAECPRCFAKGYVTSPVTPPSNGNGGTHEQDADLTGPTVYGTEQAHHDPATAATIQSLRDRGFMVVEPLSPPRPVAP